MWTGQCDKIPRGKNYFLPWLLLLPILRRRVGKDQCETEGWGDLGHVSNYLTMESALHRRDQSDKSRTTQSNKRAAEVCPARKEDG